MKYQSLFKTKMYNNNSIYISSNHTLRESIIRIFYSLFSLSNETRITSNMYTKDKDFNEVTWTRKNDNQKTQKLTLRTSEY